MSGSIRFGFDREGGFIAVDDDTLRSNYACPTSIHAEEAKQRPDEVAAEMLGKLTLPASRSDQRYYRQACGWLADAMRDLRAIKEHAHETR